MFQIYNTFIQLNKYNHVHYKRIKIGLEDHTNYDGPGLTSAHENNK